MSATPSVVIKKSTPYRGVPKIWGNRYHFNGGTPPDTAHWLQLFDNITAAEKLIFDPNTTIVEAIGYAAGSDVPVATKTYSLAGTMTAFNFRTPGDVAGLVRYATAARSSKNHPVYLFNYYHGVGAQNSTTGYDTWWASQVTTVTTYANLWISGISDGTTSYNRAGPNGASATGVLVEQFLTHRDFRR